MRRSSPRAWRGIAVAAVKPEFAGHAGIDAERARWEAELDGRDDAPPDGQTARHWGPGEGLAGQPAWQGETRGVGPGLPWTPMDAPVHGPHRESHVHSAVRTVLDAAMADPAGNAEAIRALSRALEAHSAYLCARRWGHWLGEVWGEDPAETGRAVAKATKL